MTKKSKIPSYNDVQEAEFRSENMALYSVKLELKNANRDHCHLASDLKTGTGTAELMMEEGLNNISSINKVTNLKSQIGRQKAMTTNCLSQIETKNRGGGSKGGGGCIIWI